MKPRIFHSEKSLMNSILLTSFHRTARTPPGHSGLFSRLSGLYLFKLLIPAWANSPGFIHWKGASSGSFQPTFVTLGSSLQPELLFWLPVDQVFEGESKSQNHQGPLIKALSDPSSFVQHHHKFNSQAKLNDDKLLNLSTFPEVLLTEKSSSLVNRSETGLPGTNTAPLLLLGWFFYN